MSEFYQNTYLSMPHFPNIEKPRDDSRLQCAHQIKISKP